MTCVTLPAFVDIAAAEAMPAEKTQNEKEKKRLSIPRLQEWKVVA